MAIIRNEDLKIMVEVEDLLHEKLVETKAIEELDGIWTDYWNLVERLIVDKKKKYKNSKPKKQNCLQRKTQNKQCNFLFKK